MNHTPGAVEALESRTLFSVTNTNTFVDVAGSATEANRIVLSLDVDNQQYHFTVNGQTTSMARNTVGVVRIRGGEGNDLITIEPAVAVPVHVFGRAGNDLIQANGSVYATLDGGEGNDTLLQSKYMTGGGGDDVLVGAAGRICTLFGDDGDDTLIGTDSAFDHFFAGSGDDTIYAGAGEDVIYAGPDHDTVFADAGDDTVYGGHGDDRILGGGGEDELHGGDGNDQLVGQDDADVLYGDAGNDVLNGGQGNDRLFAGTGRNVLTGGTHLLDRFYFNWKRDTLVDRETIDLLYPDNLYPQE